MDEIAGLTDQLRRSFVAEAWHGPSVLEILADVNAAQAARRPLPAAHSIWEIVLHMTTWKDAVRRRALGEQVPVTPEQDWPPVRETSDAAWAAALAGLRAAHADLVGVVGGLSARRLEEPLVPGGNTGYVQLHGIVQHDLYHAGQIILLKRG